MRSSPGRYLVTASIVMCLWGARWPVGARQETPTPASDATFTMALTGDSIITRKLSVHREPAFTRMIETIRGADAAFTNIEMLFHDYEHPAMTQSGGTYMRAEPALVDELVWAGFDLGSLANNHSGDYGSATMLASARLVADAGIVAAGVGRSLAEAREAKFLGTSKGRIALISVASTFPDHSRAGRSRDDIPARPGLNPLRHSETTIVTREQMDGLRAILRDLGRTVPEGDVLSFFGRRFAIGDGPGIRTEPDPDDLAAIAAVVRNASRLADYTVVTIHAHEGAETRVVPAEFLVTFARAMVDAGADLFVGHGPHVLRGIEIYKGAPIFYSLGDFVFQNETLLRLPDENYAPYGLAEDAHVADFNDRRYDNDTRGFPADREIWEAVIAMPTWTDGRLSRIELHPITLGFGQPRTVRGRPLPAEGALAETILGNLQERSAPYGTTIAMRDGIGVIEIAPTATEQGQ
jgi:poly-gamma-glutamate synthesis protein (capsule biosynthesis protein)